MAEIFASDFETGDLTDFDSSTTSGDGSVSASTDAKKTGSYGCEFSSASSGDGYLTQYVGGDEASEFWLGFHVYLSSDISIANYGSVNLFRLRDDDFGYSYFTAYREASGDGPPTRWKTWDGQSTTNFSTDEWHWVVLHVRWNDSTTGGSELKVDGDTLYTDFNNDMSGKVYLRDLFRIGSCPDGAYMYMDNIILDDASEPTEPTDAGGTTMPIFLHHYKMAGGL